MNSRAIYSTEPAQGWLPWGALAPFLCIVFIAVPSIGASFALEHVRLADAQGDPMGPMGLPAFLLIPFGLVGLTVLAWVRFVERRPFATIGWTGTDRTKRFLGGIGVGLATIFGVVVAIWIAGGFEADGYVRAFVSPSELPSVGFLLVCFAVQSSVEELLFRGWLLSAVARKLNVALAIVLTSVVFALMHYAPHQHPLITLNILLFSVFACAWSLEVGSIWGVMGWHTGWNWLLAVGFEVPVTGIDAKMPALLVKLIPHGSRELTGGPQGPEGSYMCTLFFAGSIAFWMWRARGTRPAVKPADPSQPLA